MMRREQNVCYASTLGRELALDIYYPADAKKMKTAVLLLHGGGWRMGDKANMEVFAEALAEQGFVAIAVQYRLLGATGEAPVWPAPLEDIQHAIFWVREHAEMLEISSERIVLMGFSAGGHLALLTAGAAANDVAAVIAFFPPVQFAVGACEEGVNRAEDLLGAQASKEDAYRLSPLFAVTPSFPPTFLLHGNADKVVSSVTSVRMYEALRHQGVPAEIHLFTGHTHEFARLPSMIETVVAEITLFLKRIVVDSEFYRQENLELNMFAKMDL